MSQPDEDKIELRLPAGALLPDAQTVPLMARLGHEIPKPNSWEDFQRKCVILYRAELNDPNAQEYGRQGQKQHGIDILGRRDGKPDRWVAIQCRKQAKPLKHAKILSDCQATLALRADVKEIIFATTAPNDTGATDAAIEVEAELRAQGRDVLVTVFGWENLCTLIAVHPKAYAAFFPAAYSSPAPQRESLDTAAAADLREQMKALSGQIAAMRAPILGSDDDTQASGDGQEDIALHARIDAYRDLFKNDHQPALAEAGLKGLIGTYDPSIEPRAEFRIKTNLGSIAFERGRESEAIAYYEQSHVARPDDPVAIANLALARTIGGRYAEAMELAREALEGEPQAQHAVGYLLQAAARSEWDGNPETLIPEKLAGTPEADLGLSEFWRIRDTPEWPEKVIKVSRLHPETAVFGRLRAQAVLTIISKDNVYLPGGSTAIPPEEVDEAANELKATADYFLRIGFAGKDISAYTTNAAVILRYRGRIAEAEDLLARALAAGVQDDAVVRMLGLIQSIQGKREAALTTLEPLKHDPEAMLLTGELLSEKKPREALNHVHSLPEGVLGEKYNKVRWGIVAELAIRLGDAGVLEEALANLKDVGELQATIDLLRLRDLQARGAPEAELEEKARAVAASVPTDVDMPTRVLVAGQLREFERPLEASRLLEGYVDLKRKSPAALLYLGALAAARRDDAFREALREAAPEVRESADVLWLTSAHAWNVGDLETALRTVTSLLKLAPENFRARLLKIEILARQNKLQELTDELSQPVEELGGAHFEGQLRIATLLDHFGFSERAAAFAYRLFLSHRDESRAWMTLSSVVLFEGQQAGPRLFDVERAGPNVAVDVTFDDGESQFFVIEPDAELRSLDLESREPDHPLASAVVDKATGDEFTVDERKGRITQLRHKCVARFHYVLAHYEERFPNIFGFIGVKFDPESPDGLDDIKVRLAERERWVREQSKLYEAGNMPLAVLAISTGTNPIETAVGLGSIGIKLKVAFGTEIERQEASRVSEAHGRTGCVLDLWTYWTAQRLGMLDAVEAVCGPISVAQHTLDELRIYRSRAAESLDDGLKTMGMRDGKVQITEAGPEFVSAWVENIDQAILSIEGRGANKAVVATDSLPDTLLEHLQTDSSHLFDEAILALHSNLLLVSDDLPLRLVAKSLGVKGGMWLHSIAAEALKQGVIDQGTFVGWTASLIEFGETYLGVSGVALIWALEKDLMEGREEPGPEFLALSQVIGGEIADPRSHVLAVLNCVKPIWSTPKFIDIRQKATSRLFRQLLSGRYRDYGIILRAVAASVRDDWRLSSYLIDWARGHFVSDALY